MLTCTFFPIRTSISLRCLLVHCTEWISLSHLSSASGSFLLIAPLPRYADVTLNFRTSSLHPGPTPTGLVTPSWTNPHWPGHSLPDQPPWVGLLPPGPTPMGRVLPPGPTPMGWVLPPGPTPTGQVLHQWRLFGYSRRDSFSNSGFAETVDWTWDLPI